MWKYIVKRILMLIPVMLATIFVVYFIMDQSEVDPAKKQLLNSMRSLGWMIRFWSGMSGM